MIGAQSKSPERLFLKGGMFRIEPADHAYAPIRRRIYRQPELR